MWLIYQVYEVFDIDHIAAIYNQVQPGIFDCNFFNLQTLLTWKNLLKPHLGKFRIDQGISVHVFQVEVLNMNPLEEGVVDG